jgi:hypothetical protein
LRLLGLRPRCEACRIGGHGVTVDLVHEPGEEIQFDWLELSETPWGEPAYVLVGALLFSGRCRAVISEGTTFAHLVDAIDGVLAARTVKRYGPAFRWCRSTGDSYRMRGHRARLATLRAGLNHPAEAGEFSRSQLGNSHDH